MNVDFSFIDLAFRHGWVFQAVIAGLLVVSLASWTVIFRKWSTLSAALRDLPVVEQLVSRDGGCVPADVHRLAAGGGLARVLTAGWDRIAALRRRGVVDGELVREHARYAWEAGLSRELQQLGQNLPFLATVGSVSPYVGLFGTVLGVIDALTGMKVTEGVNLATVAPGIAEALVATAVGLCAAIPATVGYNLFAARIERLSDAWLTIVGDAELQLLGQSPLAERTVAVAENMDVMGENSPISISRDTFSA